MNINPKMIKIARHSRGMSLADLSDVTGINKATLSKLQSGIQPSATQISKISEALKYPPSFFALDISEARYSDFFYRKRTTMLVKDREKIDAQIEVLRIAYDQLLESAEIPEARILAISTKTKMAPEAVANMAREFYNTQRGPLVNFINILERNGICVCYLDSDCEKFDGVTTYTNRGFPLIILNKNKPSDRKRFTLAHELGHIIMHFPFRFENDFYQVLKNDKDNVFENEADRFASEFLMPTNDIFEDLQHLTYSKLGILKQYWNVSKSSLIRKAKATGCIGDNKYSSLMIELSRHGERKSESGGVVIDDPKLLKKILDVHKVELGYFDTDLADHLYISLGDLNEIVTVHNANRLRIAI